MSGNVLELPQCRPQHLAAQLLRERDSHRLGLAVGVIRAEPDPEAVIQRNDDRLDLAGCVGPENFELVGLHDVGRSIAIEHRHGRGARHADGRQFLDVMVQRRFVTPGPAGDDQRLRRHAHLIGAILEVPCECQHYAPSPPLSWMKRTTVSMPLPVFKLVNTKGRAPRIFFASRSITSSEAPTCGARSTLLITSRSERVIPGPPLEGILSPAATSIT